MLKFEPARGGSATGRVLVVSNKQGALGTIRVDGRWPGRWKSWENSAHRSASAEEMLEIAQKCAEVKEKGR